MSKIIEFQTSDIDYYTCPVCGGNVKFVMEDKSYHNEKFYKSFAFKCEKCQIKSRNVTSFLYIDDIGNVIYNDDEINKLKEEWDRFKYKAQQWGNI